LACHQHDQAVGILPDGGEGVWTARTIVGGMPAGVPKQNWGWAYQILPYIEQGNLWSQTTDSDVYGTTVSLYFCPSRRSPTVLSTTQGGNRAQIDYAGNAGTDTTGSTGWGYMGNGKDAPIVRRPDGTTQRGHSVGLGDISDGTSNTLLAGEKCMNVGQLANQQGDDDAGFVEGWDFDVIRWGYFQPSPDWNDSNAQYILDYPTCPLRSAFGSSHNDVFNAVLCDGSVRAISYTVALDTFKKLCSRNDGQPLPADAF